MPTVWLFGLTIFTSSLLLFALEPMFARMALPLLGGTPAVWNTCMLFFQTVLLAGYAYAHFVARRLAERGQIAVHLVVVLSPLFLFLLPFGIPAGWNPPAEETPVFWLLGLMTVAIGAPFFVVSSTTPLLQKWFAGTSHASAHDPYFLYGASNLGSMLALLSYPFLIEPNLGLARQSVYWTWGYGGFAIMIIACALVLWRQSQPDSLESQPTIPQGKNEELTDKPRAPLNWKERLWWIVLAFVPSSWLLGLTTYLTTDIAPVPLLWIVPLSLYLLSFILVFARRPLLKAAWMTRLFPWSVMLLAFSVILQAAWPTLLLHLVVFFIGSMVCHGDLVKRRPAVSHLTEYYLLLSVGGMLGGLFNAIAAPLLFPRPLEYPLTVLLACLLQPSFLPNPVDKQQSQANSGRRLELILLGLFVGTALLLKSHVELQASSRLVYAVIFAVPLLILSTLLDLPKLFAACVGTALILNAFDQPSGDEILVSRRSFYGVHRVVADQRGNHRLMHGMTAHGVQSRIEGRRCMPLAYYHPSGPLGDLFARFDGKDKGQQFALVGLGSGAAICYRQPGQEFTFYEIDPIVKELAENPAYFSYLKECGGGEYAIVLGDGRLQLAEARAGQYDMILFDAFSSDAIPVHLLTREAFEIYLEKLAEGGLLAFHISNSHVDLEPVIANLAADAGLVASIRQDGDSRRESLELGLIPSTYIAVARKPSDFDPFKDNGRWQPCSPDPKAPLWTDDFSNIVRILKWFR